LSTFPKSVGVDYISYRIFGGTPSKTLTPQTEQKFHFLSSSRRSHPDDGDLLSLLLTTMSTYDHSRVQHFIGTFIIIASAEHDSLIIELIAKQVEIR